MTPTGCPLHVFAHVENSHVMIMAELEEFDTDTAQSAPLSCKYSRNECKNRPAVLTDLPRTQQFKVLSEHLFKSLS